MELHLALPLWLVLAFAPFLWVWAATASWSLVQNLLRLRRNRRRANGTS
jgi:hypothetical protein